MADAVLELGGHVGLRAACAILGVSRATLYRRPTSDPPGRSPRAPPKWALSAEERRAFLALAHSDEFLDSTPAEIYFALLDADQYICSIRTMYRILAEQHEVRERRNQARHPTYTKPELLATGPRQLWTWDITKLRGPSRGVFLYLYVLIDVFSRYVVGWMCANREDKRLAETLIHTAYLKEGIQPGQLTTHSDRGPAMKAETVVELHIKLGITKSFSRPYVSDDNPYSESQFRTLKYRHDFPERFGSLEDGRTFCRRFFAWYNDEHYHSGICWLTPATVHQGRDKLVLAARHATMLEAFDRSPERFPNGRPRLQQLPAKVWINPPDPATAGAPVLIEK